MVSAIRSYELLKDSATGARHTGLVVRAQVWICHKRQSLAPT